MYNLKRQFENKVKQLYKIRLKIDKTLLNKDQCEDFVK